MLSSDVSAVSLLIVRHRGIGHGAAPAGAGCAMGGAAWGAAPADVG